MTDLVFILDMSGSMSHLKSDTVGGYNSLLEENKKEKDEIAKVTTVFFDDRYLLIHDRVDIQEVKQITDEYVPKGMTALFDSIGRTIAHLDSKEDKADKVIVTIITDGLENASREWKSYQIKQLIENKKKDGWIISFIGANIDIDKMVEDIGLDRKYATSYTASAVGTDKLYKAMAKGTVEARKAKDTVMFEQAIYSVMDDIE